jgi:cation diffusion facilitator family transporter
LKYKESISVAEELTNRYPQARNITLIGAAGNCILGFLKIILGWLGHSSALLADGIHSLADLLSDSLVLMASYFGSQKADVDHPYGHQRIETAAALFVALLVVLAGILIGWEALEHLIKGVMTQPQLYVLWIAIISVLVNEILYHITLRVGRRIQSPLLITHAWHHRGDGASSLVVVIGVIGSLFGAVYLDAVAAVIVAGLIIKAGIQLGWTSVRELIDTGVSERVLATIESAIKGVAGVRELTQLRTRCMADNILIDAHISVDPYLSVSEGHYIVSQIHKRLEAENTKISDVTLHVLPEGVSRQQNENLPARQELLAQLMAFWINCPEIDYVHNIILHYLDGHIEVVFSLPLFVLENWPANELREAYSKAVKELPMIHRVDIVFC